MTSKIHPVILCGGSGTRLWPLSTPKTPKQFLALTSAQSMIENTAGRFADTARSGLDFGPLLVVGSKRHEGLLDMRLPDARKILEPFGRDSAPAVAAASLVLPRSDLVLILPADHDIQDVAAFHDAIAVGAEAANEGAIVTFGIQPTHPATGYGYIKAGGATGALDVEAFVEKPNLETAQSYLNAGSYYWNAGIFLFKANTMLEALDTFAPSVLASTRAALSQESLGKIELNSETFKSTPSISIDYAVMEKTSNVKTVPVSMGWSDVGGYQALHELLTKSDDDNYAQGPVHIQNSTGLYVRSEGPAITINGVANLVIVATQNEVMITPKDNDAAVKELGKIVQEHRHTLGISPELRKRAKDWLQSAFDVWSEIAWDPVRGGFVEQLDMNGVPDYDANRRVRVQARQVFSFAKAIELGWCNSDRARELVEKGLTYLDQKARHPNGGWVHVVDPEARPVDDKRDLYDHAFIILAGATAHKVLQSHAGLSLAEEAVTFIESKLRDEQNGGWREALPSQYPRRANPHMHVLEAMLAYHEATGSAESLQHASEIVGLFETKFFNPLTNAMGEFFDERWAAPTDNQEIIFEPGHHYEWATLLLLFEQITGHDTLSWRRRLIRHADNHGINKESNFAYNSLRESGGVLNSNSRLWHQLEMLRAYLLHPELAPHSKIEDLFERIFETYLDPGPMGGWVDEIDSQGNSISGTVPASMLYHAITAFEVISAKS